MTSEPCPKCGAEIPAEAPQGLCPRCLLSQVSFPTETVQAAPANSVPPTLEALAAAFPHLEIIELIGQGGMGFVFKARQPKLDRLVALKILNQSLAVAPTFPERFTREGRALARLNHPNVVAIHDFGQANGFFYLLMEYVDGVNLRQAMCAGRFTPAQTLSIVPKICDALQYAHNEGVLHRDIKPENILLDSKGRVKIADFGIAKLVGETRTEAALTGSDVTLGTPNYMAPEQIEQPADVDHRADIYSLGVVFYELLTGELPLGRFALPSEKTSVDARVDQIVARALSKERELRQQSATDFKTQVETVAIGEEHARSVRGDSPQRTPVSSNAPVAAVNRWPRRWFLLVSAVVMLPPAVIVSYLVWLALAKGGTRDPGRATVENVSNNVSIGQPSPVAAAKTVVLMTATNRLAGETKTYAISVMTEAIVSPGETLRALIQYPDGRKEEAITSLSFSRRLNNVQTTSWFSWLVPDSFGQPGAEAAVAQLRQNKTDRPIALPPGEPVALFTITNHVGAIMIGSIEFQRSRPLVSAPTSAVQASIRVRPTFTGNMLIFFTADVPQGYSLQATTRSSEPDAGQAHTHIAHSKGTTDYNSSWMLPNSFAKPQQQQAAAQLEKLADRGPLQVQWGKPYQLFSVTNELGEVTGGCLELFGSPELTNP